MSDIMSRLRDEIERLRAQNESYAAELRAADARYVALVREVASGRALLPSPPVVIELTGAEAEQAWAAATRPGDL